jgi:hypothetical protein
MANETPDGVAKRTAVLVVHGMGSQRPLETVRGVVNAVWRDNPENKVWFHPEHSAADIDLTVQTTSAVPGTANRRIDFHELYWAHLIAETRAVAVLLWLFELARRGPRLKRGMKPLWWGGTVYLALLILSVVFLASEIVERLAKVDTERAAMILTPVITLSIVASLCAVWAARYGSISIAWRSSVLAAGAALALLGAWWLSRNCPEVLEGFATHWLPATFAGLVTLLLMGKWGILPFVFAYLISFLFHFIKLWVFDGVDPVTLLRGDEARGIALAIELVPWSLTSTWSSIAAWLFIASYFVLSTGFLQPYLGDVARYLRNSPANIAGRREIRRAAVDTLLALHESGKYDRIVVVAHSLGTFVAYDMLRATFARMYRDMPANDARSLPEFIRIDEGKLDRSAARRDGRALVRAIHDLVSARRDAKPVQSSDAAAAPKPKAWLVTDFITLGSPLTHAQYLLYRRDSPVGPVTDESKLFEDFDLRVRERELPTCRPKQADGDGVLSYERKGKRYFHHAALFGMTRWTNIYFPLEQVFWGDAIGGPVALYETNEKEADGQWRREELFGNDIIDVAVSKETSGAASFFTHTAYWSVDRTASKVDPPHVLALKVAIDLADTGNANHAQSFAAIPGLRVTNP